MMNREVRRIVRHKKRLELRISLEKLVRGVMNFTKASWTVTKSAILF